MNIAYKQDIQIGKAYIRTFIGDEVTDYEIYIYDLHYSDTKQNKGIEFCVTDEKLLGLTNGIVQGMSGSPIIQNGKVIGAVTHVMINDPARGYGIFIENMLEQ
jgi:stage IV sporulation protein B